jgi:hypothetical protein
MGGQPALVSVYVHVPLVCVCVCVCECEREREFCVHMCVRSHILHELTFK